jgi:hypothetical protein
MSRPKGLTGTSMGGVEVSPARRRRQSAGRRRQEHEWAGRQPSGTLTRSPGEAQAAQEPECGCCELNDYDPEGGEDYAPCANCGHSPEEHES